MYDVNLRRIATANVPTFPIKHPPQLLRFRRLWPSQGPLLAAPLRLHTVDDINALLPTSSKQDFEPLKQCHWQLATHGGSSATYNHSTLVAFLLWCCGWPFAPHLPDQQAPGCVLLKLWFETHGASLKDPLPQSHQQSSIHQNPNFFTRSVYNECV